MSTKAIFLIPTAVAFFLVSAKFLKKVQIPSEREYKVRVSEDKEKKNPAVKSVISYTREGNKELRQLYPPIEPYMTGFLEVTDGHQLYYEQCGNPKGVPIVCLHGGPGGGINATMRRYFDPHHYRIILFDQRGAGRSKPQASLEANTTWHLVGDIERLRKSLNVDSWLVWGGSWGATLALAYAETHTSRVKALILRGVFTIRRKELLWFYQEGASWLFPDAWDKYLRPIPEAERGDLMSAYYRRVTSTDEKLKLEAAKAWTTWEMSTSKLYEDKEMTQKGEEDEFATTFARIETHYFVHGAWLERDAQLIEDAHKLRDIPGVIVQGRYDVVCPFRSAWDLHQVWPQAQLAVVEDAGHSAMEIGIRSELIEASDKFRGIA